MFERRLKIFLAIISAITLVLLARAAHIQILNGRHWRERASESMRRSQLLDTTRGRILDRNGHELATDEACVDAAVDYRAIERDPEWMKAQALARLKARAFAEWRSADKERRSALLDEELAGLRRDLDALWTTLARVSGRSLEEIDQTRESIRQRVQMRRRYVWYRRYQEAILRHQSAEPEPWYRQWLISGDNVPQLDSFSVAVAEQSEPHVILHAIDDETSVLLGKMLDRFPGLELRKSKYRVYPRGSAACHVLGRLASVTQEDLRADPNNRDELRQYYPNDLIGRSGIEALCEQALRGSRGRIERLAGQDSILRRVEPVPGNNVRTTIDVELQLDILGAFTKKREFRNSRGEITETRQNNLGAVAVIHIPTGEVLALVSNPTFDVNRFDSTYAELAADHIRKPLLNRATQAQYEPGSSVKPVVGIAALMEGVSTLADTIECTGYLVLGAQTFRVGRCWVARQYEGHPEVPSVKHHPVPVPHPTGFLTVTEAIERSCNVVFETLAERLGMGRLAGWFARFGLGEPTGVGIEESAGRIPRLDRLPRARLAQRMMTWFAGIGQGPITVTPLQMANVVATIGRDGVWVRPRLVLDGGPARRPTTAPLEERIDLRIPRQVMAAIREGMVRVVNSDAGTGRAARRSDMLVAAKTGSAQAPKLSVPELEADGRIARDAQGRVRWRIIEPNAYDWYQGTGDHHTDLAHAWYVGFAPADDPQIAFAVLVEYGGSGGRSAGAIAADVLEACVARNYLVPPKK